MAAKNTKRHKEVRSSGSRGRSATLKNSVFLHLCRSSFLRFSRSLRLSRTSSISSACICVICGQFGTEFGQLCLIRGLRSRLVEANGRAGSPRSLRLIVSALNAESAETQRAAEKYAAIVTLAGAKGRAISWVNRPVSRVSRCLRRRGMELGAPVWYA